MISELRLRNFKCFGELNLPLGSLTILSGVNSSGKSSILQALLLLHQSYRVGTLEKGTLALNGALVGLGSAQSNLREDAATQQLDLALDWDDGHKIGFAYTVNEQSGEFSELPASRAAGEQRTGYYARPPFSVCKYVAAERLGPRPAYATAHSLTNGDQGIGTHGEFAAQYLASNGNTLVRVEKLRRNTAPSNSLRNQVESWLGLFCPDVEIKAELERELEVTSLNFTFPGRAGRTNPRRSTHVGFGLTYVLPILVAVLSANPGDLVLVENPEAHLHPKAQRLVTDLLGVAAAAGIQLVVETHSDHVLNAARLAVKNGILNPASLKVHFFSHEPNSHEPLLVSPVVDERGSIQDWPQGFFDEWDLALGELLKR